ncbi:MAG: hypothetical protein KAI44_00525, partial [Methylococcales bacterium]|nr:hypothetical protein [Methylococcales bacterium]
MNKTAFYLVLCSLFFPVFGWANTLPDQLAVPGGIVKIPVADISQPAPKVFFYDKRVLVTANETHWIALVGIPLSAKAGEHKLNIKTAKNNQQQTFSIVDKNYPAQYLTIKKKRMVTGFTDEDLKKINADKKA